MLHSHILSEQDIYASAPSVFATEAHDSRSERFRPIPTINMVRALAAEGWGVSKAMQCHTRVADKAPFTKHMIRFRKIDGDARRLQVGDNILELLLINGNDGSAAYNLDAGIFRMVCSNGMIVKTAGYGNIKVRHTGDAVEKVLAGSAEVLKNAELALRAPQDWGSIKLTDREQSAFARGAAIERWGTDEANNLLSPVKPDDLLEARRFADTGNDLWRVFNRVQENVTQGGQPGRTASSRRTTTRRIRGIDQDVRVNRGLWEMAEWLSKNAENAPR